MCVRIYIDTSYIFSTYSEWKREADSTGDRRKETNVYFQNKYLRKIGIKRMCFLFDLWLYFSFRFNSPLFFLPRPCHHQATTHPLTYSWLALPSFARFLSRILCARVCVGGQQMKRRENSMGIGYWHIYNISSWCFIRFDQHFFLHVSKNVEINLLFALFHYWIKIYCIPSKLQFIYIHTLALSNITQLFINLSIILDSVFTSNLFLFSCLVHIRLNYVLLGTMSKIQHWISRDSLRALCMIWYTRYYIIHQLSFSSKPTKACI